MTLKLMLGFSQHRAKNYRTQLGSGEAPVVIVKMGGAAAQGIESSIIVILALLLPHEDAYREHTRHMVAWW